MPKKVIIATLFYNMQGYSPYIESMVASSSLLTKIGINFEFWAHSGDSYVDRARNTVCSRFLDSNGDYLLFVDSDMAWEPLAIPKILTSPYDVTGCAYPLKNNWDQWGVSLKYDSSGKPIIDSEGFVEVPWIPAGFMLLTRRAIEKMVKLCSDDFYYDVSANSKTPLKKYYNLFKCDNDKTGEIRFRRGEDVNFCKVWTDSGEKILLYPDIEFGHYGTKEWSGKFKTALDEILKPKEPELVSIVIPCFNYGKYLGEAIESALSQTYKNIEIIVVNDGSADNTDETAKKYSVTLISTQNKGVASARNTGIRASRGKWVCCLDADDVLNPFYVEKLLGKSDVVGCWYKTFGTENNIYSFLENPTAQDFLSGNRMHCSSIFKRSTWEKVGGYDENMTVTGYEDWDLWLRMAKEGISFKNIQEVLFYYRKHGKSLIDSTVARHKEMANYIFSKKSNIMVNTGISEAYSY
jgi:hypothetical protein